MSAIDYEVESTKRLNWLDITGGSAKDSLTVLDYFAAAAMQGMMASFGTKDEHVDLLVKSAFIKAEAMLAERNKRFTPQNVVKGVTGKTYG